MFSITEHFQTIQVIIQKKTHEIRRAKLFHEVPKKRRAAFVAPLSQHCIQRSGGKRLDEMQQEDKTYNSGKLIVQTSL